MTTWIPQQYELDHLLNIWIRKDFESIKYSDGDEVEDRIYSNIKTSKDVSVLSPELREKCIDWPSLYHLSPLRSNLLRPFSDRLKNLKILEIGAGCGAITRYLAETTEGEGTEVVALEGSKRRASIARERTRDLKNTTVICERFSDFSPPVQFDVITLIGVLEYAALFTPNEDPASAMLSQVRRMLKPNGILIIAIENKLGLKYFAGANEDHLGLPMYGIEDLYTKGQVRTFGKKELETKLAETGFEHHEFFYPFPDYKLPRTILSETGLTEKRFDGATLAAQGSTKDPQLPKERNLSIELAWNTIFDNEIASDLSNSFLIVANGSDGILRDRTKNTVLAWHFSVERHPEYCKQSTFSLQTENEIKVESHLLSTNVSNKSSSPRTVSMNLQESISYTYGSSLSQEITKHISRDNWTKEGLNSLLNPYFDLLNKNKIENGASANSKDHEILINGSAVDCLPQNLIIQRDGSYVEIDREWCMAAPVEFGWIIFRAALSIIGNVSRISTCQEMNTRTPFEFIRCFFEIAGSKWNRSLALKYAKMELEFQKEITGKSESIDALIEWLNIDIPNEAANRSHTRIKELLNVEKENYALSSSKLKVTEARASVQKDEIDRLNDEVERHQANLEQTQHAISHLQNQLAGQLKHSKSLEAQCQSILGSHSWRMTKPMRKIKSIIGGGSDEY